MTISLSANSQNTPESIIEKFFDNYKNKGAELAVEEMYATNPWTIRVKDAINNRKCSCHFCSTLQVFLHTC